MAYYTKLSKKERRVSEREEKIRIGHNLTKGDGYVKLK